MRASRRRVLLLVLAAGAAAAALLVLGWFPQEPARRFLESRLQQALGPSARIGRLRLLPGRLQAEIEGLVAETPAYRLDARTVRVRLNRSALLGPAISLRSVEADGVTLLIRGDAPATPASAAAPFGSLLVDRIHVTSASVRYEGDPALGVVAFDGVTLVGSIGQGALAFSAAGGTWDGPQSLALGPAHGRVRISRTLDLHLEAFEAGLVRSRVSASGPLGRVGALQPELAWSAQVDLAEIAGPAGIGDATGEVRAQGTLRTSAGGAVATADVSTRIVRSGAWALDGANGRVTYEEGRAVASLDARLLGGTATIDATVAPGGVVHGRVVARALDLARLGAPDGVGGRVSGAIDFHRREALRPFGLDAHLEADGSSGADPFRVQLAAQGDTAIGGFTDLDWAGSGRAAHGSASVVFEASGNARGLDSRRRWLDAWIESTVSTPQTGPLPLHAEVHVDGDAVQATGTLDGLGETVRFQADAQGARMRRLVASGDGIELGRLSPGWTGRAGVALDGSGTLEAPSGQASVLLEDAAWRGVPVGPATVELTAHAGHVLAQLHATDWNLDGRAEMAAGRERRVIGRLDLRETPLDRLNPLLPDGGAPLGGALTAAIDFDIPLARPADAVARVAIETLDATRGALHVRSDGPARLEWRGSAVHLEQVDLAGAGFGLRASGSVGLGDTAALDLTFKGASELDALPVPPGWTAAGRVETDLRLSGSTSRPRVTGQLTFEDAGLSGPGIPPLSIASGRVELAGDALVLPDLAVQAAGGEIVLSGRVPLAAAYPPARARADRVSREESADLHVAWRGLRAEEWPQGTSDTRLTGGLDGTLAVSGGLASLSEWVARLEVPATVLRVEEIEVRIDPVTARLAAGRIQADPVLIAAADSAIQLEGGADLLRRELEASALGALNLRALSPFTGGTALSGTAELDVSARGAWKAPVVQGSVLVDDASVRMRLLPQAVTSLSARIEFEGGSLRIPRATAVLGGGELTLSGTSRIQGGLADARFVLAGRDVTLAYPPGLRSRLDADLTFSGGPRAFLLAGEVRAVRGLYDLDLVFEQSLSAPAEPAADSPALRRIALDLRVEIQNPIQVRNNMTELQAVGSLTVRGDMNTPAPVGNLEIEPAGRVYLGGRAFEIESGRLTYRGNWDPTIEVEAADLISGADANNLSTDYEVTVRLMGSLEQPGLVMSSDPPLSEGQIVSLIATGRTDGGSAALRLAVGGQAAALLAGRLTRRLRDLGLDEVSIQPELVAREDRNETGARFTFGKRLSSRLELIYSLSLQDPEGRFILLEARPGRDVVLRAQRNDAGTYAASVGQRFQFGGPPRRRPASADKRVRVTAVRFEGDLPAPDRELADLAKVRVGQRKTVWNLQDDADRLRSRLIERGYLEAESSVRLEDGTAVFRVRSGARYDWRIEGMTEPPDLTRTIREALFEEEALERGRERVLRALHERGHLRARLRTRVEPADGRRSLVFAAEPGPRFHPVEVVFPGARALSTGHLLEEAGGAGRLVSSPGEAGRALTDAYRRAFYLTAEVGPPQVVETPGGGMRILVAVREGPRAQVGAILFEGATRPSDELMRLTGLRTGEPYDPAAAHAAADRLRDRYFRLGYANMRVQAAAVPNGPLVDVAFTIDEGQAAVLGRIVIQGLLRTREALVRRQIRLRPGAPLDPRRLASVERRLLDMGLFRRVVTSVSAEEPATLTVAIEEDDRYFGRYALSYEDRRTPEGQEAPNLFEKSTAEVDAEVRNLLGWGARAGARARVGADVRNGSVSLGIPSVPVLGSFTGTVFRIQQDLKIGPDPTTGQRRESRRTQNGLEVSWSRRLPRRAELLYGYRFEDSEVVSPDFPDPQQARTAVLRASVLRDSRDNILDARRGRFLSLSVDYAPAFLRADFQFVKGLAQAFLARPIGESLTWAHGYRLGIGTGFAGQTIRSTERFRAGGANSIRGFDTDAVGPFDALTKSFTGGEAVVIVNQELRYRHPIGVGGVLFYDGGNVFRRVGDVSLDWRHAVGAGIRWESPVGLLRFDLGLPLGRRLLAFDPPRREDPYQLVFSLGQAF